MRFNTSRLLVVAAALVASLGVTEAVADAGTPIGPKQHFIGLVNGSNAKPTIYTVCGGPQSSGRTGPVVAGQTLAVARLRKGGGYTGQFSQIYAWIVQDASVTGPQQVKFATYGTAKVIPSTVRVPCDGTGQVEFSSCPRLAPCAFGWVPDIVTVRFVNVAV